MIMDIVWLSLQVACMACLVALPPALALAWLLSRCRFPGHALVEAVVNAPLVVPPVVIGYALLLLLSPQGTLGRLLAHLGVTVVFTWRAAVLAAAVIILPLMIRSCRQGLDLVDRRLEQAASTLGASPWRILTTITLPLALPGIVHALILGFARALGEFGATITLAGNMPGRTTTLPLAIYQALHDPDAQNLAMTLSLVSIAVCVIALLLGEWSGRLLRQRLMGTEQS